MKTLVLGLGNPILSDDGVGLRIAAEVKRRVSRLDVTVLQSELGGLNLLDLLAGYDRAIILDAIQTKNGKPGQIHRLTETSLETSHHANSTHGIDFKGTIELGRKLGLDLPSHFVIFAVEARDISTFGTKLSPEVEGSIATCVEEVLRELEAP